MSVVCWTVFHNAAVSAARGTVHVVRAMRRITGPITRHAARMSHHVAHAAVPSHTWVEVVCKVIPAAVVGGGLLVPHPVNPPPLPAQPPPIVAPALPSLPWLFPPGAVATYPTPVQPYPTPVGAELPPGTGPMLVVPPPYIGPVPPVAPAPEPSSAVLLFGGAACLLLIRLATGRTRLGTAHLPGGSQPESRKAHLVGRRPILRALLRPNQRPVPASEHQ